LKKLDTDNNEITVDWWSAD